MAQTTSNDKCQLVAAAHSSSTSGHSDDSGCHEPLTPLTHAEESNWQVQRLDAPRDDTEHVREASNWPRMRVDQTMGHARRDDGVLNPWTRSDDPTCHESPSPLLQKGSDRQSQQLKPLRGHLEHTEMLERPRTRIDQPKSPSTTDHEGFHESARFLQESNLISGEKNSHWAGDNPLGGFADVLILCHGNELYSLCFAPHGISDGNVTIQDVRESAVAILRCEPKDLVLRYQGKVLMQGDNTPVKAHDVERGSQLEIAVERSSLPNESAHIPRAREPGLVRPPIRGSNLDRSIQDHQGAAEGERDRLEISITVNGAVSNRKQREWGSAYSLTMPGTPDAVLDTVLLTRNVEADETESPPTCCTETHSESNQVVADPSNPTPVSEGEMSFTHSDERGSLPGLWTPVLDSAFFIVSGHLASLLVKTYPATLFIATGAAGTSSGLEVHAGSDAAKATTAAIGTLGRQMTSKRKFRTDEEYEDGKEDEENDGDRPCEESNSNRTSISRPLACPYFKHDPTRYSERNNEERSYRSCSTCLLKDISRAKQHLYRIHRRPDHYCARCYQVFSSVILLKGHIRNDPPCRLSRPMFQEKMTVGQMAQIKRRHPGKSVSDNWYGIFRILFPHSASPASPYAESMCNNGIQRFLSFAEAQGSNLLREVFVNELRREPLMSPMIEHIVADTVERAAPLFMRDLIHQFSTIDHSLNSAIQAGATPIQVDANNGTTTVVPDISASQTDDPTAPPMSLESAVRVLHDSELNSATFGQDMLWVSDPVEEYCFNLDSPMIDEGWN